MVNTILMQIRLRENYRAFKNKKVETMSPKEYNSYTVPHLRCTYREPLVDPSTRPFVREKTLPSNSQSREDARYLSSLTAGGRKLCSGSPSQGQLASVCMCVCQLCLTGQVAARCYWAVLEPSSR
uniref:Uncharacterized protein n=1 Tax=Timema cristinae TaxID=61476 RepID=A0A7R9GZQ2_TIMCR|nr:unnamed protein product [Timema cristinae]